MRIRTLILAFCCVLIMGTTSAHASLLTFSFTDPVDTQTGRIDLTELQMTFDKVTGAYTIDIFASAAAPFDGSFRLNVNLFNPDTGTTADDPSFFNYNMIDVTLSTSTTIQTFTGTNTRLLAWKVGDRIAIGSAALGNPDGVSSFGSSILDLPGFSTIDLLGTASNNNGTASAIAIITDASTAVPEPSTMLLIGLGILTMLASTRWWRRTPESCPHYLASRL